jgi:hypothetical protein
MSESPVTTRWSTIIFLLVWMFSVTYVACNLKRGWVPHDEGILAQAAERILHGEMPHRDFDDPYTGGLSYLNAAGFRMLGTNLLTLGSRCIRCCSRVFWTIRLGRGNARRCRVEYSKLFSGHAFMVLFILCNVRRTRNSQIHPQPSDRIVGSRRFVRRLFDPDKNSRFVFCRRRTVVFRLS